jgi:hypothetical protein
VGVEFWEKACIMWDRAPRCPRDEIALLRNNPDIWRDVSGKTRGEILLEALKMLIDDPDAWRNLNDKARGEIILKKLTMTGSDVKEDVPPQSIFFYVKRLICVA